MDEIFEEIKEEREYQRTIGWNTSSDDKNTTLEWAGFICNYATRSICGATAHLADFRTSMVKVAALAIAAIEAYDRNNGVPKK